MPHDVFVSYSSAERGIADAACAAFEAAGVVCWMAPRNVIPGGAYPEQIATAIGEARACLLVLSEHANGSRQVQSEIEIAFNCGIPIVPFRIGDAEPAGNLRYLLAGTHWLDAGTSPLGHVDELVDRMRVVLERYAPARNEAATAGAPARKIPRARSNLPHGSTSLVGRTDDLEEIARLLRSSRVVTIVGTGGIGKTRLSIALGESALATYADGVWFVDLAAIDDPSLVVAAVADTVGVREAPGEARLETVTRSLRAHSMLLILDNCEHVVATAASLVERLVRECPQVSVLATSRQALGVAGEELWRLEPLPEANAVELFVQRASAAHRAFSITDATRSLVVEICRSLDGIPLAIELAAARVRSLSLDDILRRLNERFRFLTSTVRSALPRQQTLAAAIAWSHDLLSAEEQALFRRLAVFRGSFSFEAAAALRASGVSPDEYAVLDLVTSLVDKSLVVPNVASSTRYRLLETIRQFARASSDERGESVPASNDHAAYFGRVAGTAYEEFDTRLPPGWLERLSPDLDNFRAALEWTLSGGGDRHLGAQLAGDCGPVFLRLVLLREGLQWCERARNVANLSTVTAARVEYVASMLHNNLAENQDAIACAQRAVERFRTTSDDRGLTRALSQLAQLYARAKQFDEARALAQEAIARARALSEPRVLISVLRRCAFSLPPESAREARDQFAEALAIAKSERENEETALVLEWWAYREASLGSLARAIELSTEGLDYADRNESMYLEGHIACWALALGRVDDATPHARHLLVLATENRHPHLHARAIAYLVPSIAARDVRQAAMLLGYAKSRLKALDFEPDADDVLALDRVEDAIARAIQPEELASLVDRGSAWSDQDAAVVLGPEVSTPGENSSARGDP